MKSKFLFILLMFFCYVGCAQNKSLQKYSTDTTLSHYISAHFYSDKENDSCYSGIHFIKNQFSGARFQVISISGELPDQYIVRLKHLIETFATSYFNPKFINYCKKNKKMIVQPILFDISTNCVSHDSSWKVKNPGKVLKDTTGKQILLLVSHYSIMQNFSMINSFKEIGGDNYTNCIMLKSSIIKSKKIKDPRKA